MSDLSHKNHLAIESLPAPSIRSLILACLLPLSSCTYTLGDTIVVGCVRRDIVNVTETDCHNAGNTFASGACYDFLDNTTDAAVSIHRDPVICSQAGGQIMRFTTSSMSGSITHTVVPVGNNADSGVDAGRD